nr:hypothetical protein [Polymorphospora rubra]
MGLAQSWRQATYLEKQCGPGPDLDRVVGKQAGPARATTAAFAARTARFTERLRQ